MKVSSIIKNPVARKVTNSIKTPMRKAVASAMMMTAVLGGTAVANAKTTNNDRVINQTEVVSAEGAKALASMTLQSPTVPKVHMNSLDRRILALYPAGPERNQNLQVLNQTYNDYGTYVASIYIQHLLDQEYFVERFLKKTDWNKVLETFESNRGEDFITEEQCQNSIDFIIDNLSNTYSPWILGKINNLISSGDFSFENCNKMLDDIANTNSWIDKEWYDLQVLRATNIMNDSVDAKALTLAHKVRLIGCEYVRNLANSVHRTFGYMIYGNSSHGLNADFKDLFGRDVPYQSFHKNVLQPNGFAAYYEENALFLDPHITRR